MFTPFDWKHRCYCGAWFTELRHQIWETVKPLEPSASRNHWVLRLLTGARFSRLLVLPTLIFFLSNDEGHVPVSLLWRTFFLPNVQGKGSSIPRGMDSSRVFHPTRWQCFHLGVHFPWWKHFLPQGPELPIRACVFSQIVSRQLNLPKVDSIWDVETFHEGQEKWWSPDSWSSNATAESEYSRQCNDFRKKQKRNAE